MLALFIHFFGMVKWNDFISASMNNVDGTIYIGNPVDVWKLVDP